MVDNKEQWKAWLYLAPALILIGIFTVWPIFNTLRFAFLDGYNSLDAVGGTTYNLGIGNFTRVIKYGLRSDGTYMANSFISCLKNSCLLCFITVPISTLLALVIAVCLNAIKPLRKLLQTIYFLPYVTNSIAIGMVFGMMFNTIFTPAGGITSAGIVNNVLNFFGFENINWINSGSTYWANIAVLIIYIVWNALPFKILILLGGLQSINKQYYDAAKIDSASKWSVFWKITVPLLSPMLSYVLITGFIGGFKEYSSIIGIYGNTMGPTGEPGRLNTIVGYIYTQLPNGNYGTASAAALILFGIIFIFTMLNLRLSKKSVHY